MGRFKLTIPRCAFRAAQRDYIFYFSDVLDFEEGVTNGFPLVVALEALMRGANWPDFAGLLVRPEWHDRAACRGMGTAPFYGSGRGAAIRPIHSDAVRRGGRGLSSINPTCSSR